MQTGQIGPPLGTTPAGLERTRGYPREFPTDLLREASQRLAIISLVGAVLWVIGPLMALMLWIGVWPAWILNVINFAVSLRF